MGKKRVPESPYDCFFERDVARGWPGTAVERMPLVVRVDDVPPVLLDWPHRHTDFFALYVVRSGRGIHTIDDIAYSVSRGDVYAMGLGVTHCYSQCDSLISDALYFDPGIFSQADRVALAETPGFLAMFVAGLRPGNADAGSGRWLHLTPEAYQDVAGQIGELRAEWLAGGPTGSLVARALFLRLLVRLARMNASGGPGAEGRPTAPPQVLRDTAIAAAVSYMDEHFAEPLRIEHVAASVFLSTDRFTEVFAATMGRTPRDYLRHLRLEKASRLLAHTDLSVAEIGQDSGFGDSAYFARAFRAAKGITPSEFRSSMREKA